LPWACGLQNSPDLNLVDYKTGAPCKSESTTMLILKWRLIAAWSGLQQHVVDEEIDQ